MIVLGLTGSIGMGKSFAARAFARAGAAVYDADAAVHALLGPGGAAVEAVARLFPQARRMTREGPEIERPALAAAVFADRCALKRLEAVLHPRVRAHERAFLARARRRGAWLAVLEVPLLFETGGERRCDYTAVASAPAAHQRARVMARPGMSAQRLDAILARQMSDAQKRRRADFVIPTGGGRYRTLQAVRRIVRLLRARHEEKRRRRCARSFSTPRPPGSIPRTGTG